jgi:hypothetical protein
MRASHYPPPVPSLRRSHNPSILFSETESAFNVLLWMPPPFRRHPVIIEGGCDKNSLSPRREDLTWCVKAAAFATILRVPVHAPVPSNDDTVSCSVSNLLKPSRERSMNDLQRRFPSV